MEAIVSIMIVNGHMCGKDELQYKTANECLLSHRMNFSLCEENDREYDQDGSYVLYDNVREVFNRAGAAEMGVNKRWKEHKSGSMLSTDSSRNSKLYTSYPNANCTTVDLPLTKAKVTFQQLEQLMRVGLDRKKLNEINCKIV